ncbi:MULTISPECIES: LLM class F420-dependent oxidoreductase [Microbacterium]|uniref:F420-dependent glucose-6-phosphate dehydrogenase n=1 Tax=Microbacterium trichothecenolyticum TaxID=69370 RepID=A0A0M2HF95_MICTR|nr:MULTISPECIES: LLM class F420-dependent oxidoreductase [Microbacterium]KJL45309.1 F420-dependent glucose-6-phosphate dehydrogenase [Microbacterium trichothecenolyticum]MDR7191273.1 F420-dependent oxidoreductase-like protein [Microbacterium sp. BE35]
MDFGIHIADFTWRSGAAQLGPALARHVRNAEDAGIRRITVMDHFWQLPGLGPVEHEMLEAYATLGFIAAHTEKAMLHALVTGVIYRHPSLLAKQVTTLDVLSGGRVGLGIGAAWNEEECRGLGLPFPPVAQRFRELEETLQICLQMWSDSEEPYDGAIWQLERTLNSPQSISRPHPYLMIGGGGEKKTLRLVAQYADACNLGVRDELPTHKLDVLRGHCDAVGRDYDDIEKTAMVAITPESTAADLAGIAESLAGVGFTATYVFAVGIDEPERVVDVIRGAIELG